MVYKKNIQDKLRKGANATSVYRKYLKTEGLLKGMQCIIKIYTALYLLFISLQWI